MANNLDDKIDKDEILDEAQLEKVVGGFNFSTQLTGEGLEKIRQQFNEAIFDNYFQRGMKRPD